MYKTVYSSFVIVLMTISGSVFCAQNTNSDEPLSASALDASCNITCYEKTPECYITKDNSGCLDISNVKPEKKKGLYICTVKACEKKTKY